MSTITHILRNPEEKYIATVNKIHDTILKLEASLKCSCELEAIQFLRYSNLKSRDKILTSDLKKAKIRDKHMLSEQSKLDFNFTHFTRNLVERSHFSDLFRQSVTDVQLDSVDILPETLKRQVQRMWHQKYDALLSQNKQLRKQIIAMDCTMREKQKEINTLQQKLLNVAGNIVTPDKNTEKICRKCWIITNKT